MITNKSANIDFVVDQAENTVDLLEMKESRAANDFLSRLKEKVCAEKKGKKRS